MRRILTAGIGIVVVTGLLYAAAGSADPQGDPALAEQQMDQISYGVGFYLGEEIRDGLELDDVKADVDLLLMGFADGLKSNAPRVIEGKDCGGVPTPVARHCSATRSKPIASPTRIVPRLRDMASARRHVISPS